MQLAGQQRDFCLEGGMTMKLTTQTLRDGLIHPGLMGIWFVPGSHLDCLVTAYTAPLNCVDISYDFVFKGKDPLFLLNRVSGASGRYCLKRGETLDWCRALALRLSGLGPNAQVSEVVNDGDFTAFERRVKSQRWFHPIAWLWG